MLGIANKFTQGKMKISIIDMKNKHLWRTKYTFFSLCYNYLYFQKHSFMVLTKKSKRKKKEEEKRNILTVYKI